MVNLDSITLEELQWFLIFLFFTGFDKYLWFQLCGRIYWTASHHFVFSNLQAISYPNQHKGYQIQQIKTEQNQKQPGDFSTYCKALCWDMWLSCFCKTLYLSLFFFFFFGRSGEMFLNKGSSHFKLLLTYPYTYVRFLRSCRLPFLIHIVHCMTLTSIAFVWLV